MAGTSYTRQSTFSDGDTITASLFNNEYNQLVTAFSYASSGTTGHQHDGGAGEGGNIHTIGDQNFLNKIVVDGTNNRWGLFVEVSGSAVEQVRFQDGAFLPVTDSDVDLGTSSLYFKDAYIDSITTTGNVAVGGNLTVTGTTTFNGGTLTLGDSAADNVVFGADVNSSIIPNTDDTYDLGSSSQQWRNLFLDGTAEIDTLAINGTTVTSTAAELNILDGVTSTATEINLLDGVTATTAELNILDGVTSTATELNIVDGGTSATSTTLADADRVVVNDNGTMVQVALTDFETYFESALDTLSNVTTVGALNAGSITSGFGAINNGSSAITTTGTVTYGSLSDGSITITAFVDEDDMSSNSATLVPTQQSVKAYVDTQITAEDLDVTTDSGTIAIDLDSETLTISGGTGLDSSATGNAVTLAIDSTVATLTGSQTLTNKSLTAPTLTGTATVASLDISGDIDVDGTTNLDVVDIDGAVDMASTLQVDGVATFTSTPVFSSDITVNDDIFLTTDSAAIKFGNGQEVTLTHTNDVGLTLNSSNRFMFRDSAIYLSSTQDGQFTVVADTEIELNATTIDINGNILASGTLGVTGVLTANAGVVVDNFTLDGTTLSLSSGNMTLDSAGEIILDADGGNIIFYDASVNIGRISNASSNLRIQSDIDDKDIIFRGKDGSSYITALTLDMSDAGAATFNSTVTASGTSVFASLDISGDIDVDGTTNLDNTDIDGSLNVSGLTYVNSSNGSGVALKIGGESGNGLKQQFIIASGQYNWQIGAATHVSNTFSIVPSTASEGTTFSNPAINISQNGNIVFNENSLDSDFRVESNGKAYMFYIDGGNDAAFFGGSDKRGFVNIETTAVNYSSGVFNTPHIALQASVQPDDNDGFVGITFATSDSDNYGWSAGAERTSSGVGDFVFTEHNNSATGSEKLRLTQSGAATFSSTVTSTKFIADQFTSTSGDVTFRRGGSSTARLLIENGTTTSGQNLAVTGTVAISHGSGDSLTLTKSTTEPSLRFEGDTDKDFVLTISGETFSLTQNDGTTDIATFDHDTKASTFAGAVTANAGVVVDNITIDGTEIDLSSGDLTLDVAGGLIIDNGGNDTTLKAAGTTYAFLSNSSGSLQIYTPQHDKDIIFKGQDGGSTITALTLDMSNNGRAVFNAGAGFSDHVFFSDNAKAVFGGGDDLQIYHDGSNSYISDQGTGNLFLQGSNLTIEATDGTNYIAADDGVSVYIYHPDATNQVKLSTTSTGIDVTGVITTDGLTTSADINFGDNDKAVFGAGSDLQIYHDGSDSYIKDVGTGSLIIQASDNIKLQAHTGEFYFQGIKDGAAKLYYDNAETLLTTSTGIDVTGSVVADKANIGTSTAQYSGTDLTVGDNADSQNGLAIQTSTSGIGYILFGDGSGASAYRGEINYSHSADSLTLKTAGASRLTIDSSGAATFSGDVLAPGLYVGSVNTSYDFYNNGTSYLNGSVIVDDNLTVNGGVTVNNGHVNIDAGLSYQWGDSHERIEQSDGKIEFFTNNGESMTLSGGNLGVGISNPSATAHIQYTTQATGNQEYGLVINGNDSGTNGESASIFLGSINNTVRGASIASEVQSTANNHDLIFSTSSASAAPTERMRIDSSGNVGIGGSPSQKLSVVGNIASTGVATPEIELVPSGSVGNADIRFDGTTLDIRSNSSSASLLLSTASTERMRIDSSGNLLIGKTAENTTTVGIQARADGLFAAVKASAESAIFGRNTDDGNIVLFRKDGTAVGSIGTRSSGLVVGSGDVGLFFDSGVDRIFPESPSGGSARDAAIDLGTTASRFKDLHLSGTANVGGNLVVTGNLTINGTTTTLNTATLNVEDKNITLNYGSGDTSSTANGAGITIQDAVDASNDATILWDASNDRFDFSHGLTLPDNKKLLLGTGKDVELVFDGSSTILRNTAGSSGNAIFIQGGTGTGAPIYLQAINGTNGVRVETSGKVALYHGANERLYTSSGGVSVTGALSVSGNLSSGFFEIGDDTATTTATTQVSIASFSASSVRSCKLLVQITNTTDSTYHFTEVSIIHNGTTVFMTEYGTMFTGSAAEAAFTADISSGSVRLLATPASTDSMTFKVVRQMITV